MEMTESVLELNDVHQLVEQLSTLLKKAVILENHDFELVAYSAPTEEAFDSIQQKTILTKRCPLFVIEHLKKEGVIDRLITESKPIYLHLIEDTNFFKRLAISIKFRQQHFGYLWIYDPDKTINETQLDFIAKTAARIGELFYKEEFVEKNDVPTLIWKLVNGDFTNDVEVFRAAKLAQYTLPSDFTVIVLFVKDAEKLYLLDKIKSIFERDEIGYYLGKGTEIIGLVNNGEQEDSSVQLTHLIEEIKDTLSSEEVEALFIGIGNKYDSIRKVRKSYLEALEVIETMSFLNVTEQNVYFYRDLGLHRHLKAMYKKNVTEQYRNGQIVALMDKDLKTNSELVKTVWYYLKNDTKVSQTADELFIHHNTLHYRLKQVTELTSIDFTNVMEKTDLYIELFLLFHVEDYYEHYQSVLK